MAGVKRPASEANGKAGGKTAKKARVNEKPSALSAEFVVDSDDNDNSMKVGVSNKKPMDDKRMSPVQPQAKSIGKLPKTKANTAVKATGKELSKTIHKPANRNTTQVAEDIKKATKLGSPSTNGHLENADGSGADQSSSQEDSSTSVASTGSISKEKNLGEATKESKTDRSSSDSSDDTRQSNHDRSTASAKAKKKAKTRDTTSKHLSKSASPSARATSVSSTDSSSEDSSSDDSSSNERPTQPPDSPKPPAESTIRIVPYKPPEGFRPASISLSASSDLSELFSRSNLTNKEIWHLAFPSSVPMNVIHSVPMQKLHNGGTAVSYKGSDYAFESTSEHSKHILLPSEGDWYKSPMNGIARTFHLQQIHKLPDSPANPKGLSQSTQKLNTARPPCPQQPEGLKMRYRPFGDSEGRFGRVGSVSSSEDDAESAIPRFRNPLALDQADKPEERKKNRAGQEHETQQNESSSKKRSKKRVAEASTSNGMFGIAVHSKEQSPAASVQPKPGGNSTDETHCQEREVLVEATPGNTTKKHAGEAAEEKAKRRAEKTKRKEEHRRKKEANVSATAYN